MSDTGVLSASSITNVDYSGSKFWENPSNATSSNDVYAVSTSVASAASTDHLWCVNFSPSLFSVATIIGIKVEVESVEVSSGSYIIYAKLIKGGSLSGTELNISASNTTDAYSTLGGSSNMWGNTLTASDVNDANFGVAVRIYNNSVSSNNYKIDHVRMTIYYTLPVITTTSLVNGVKDVVYTNTYVTVTYGSPTYSVTVGALPTGISLNGGSGLISGTPTVVETQTFTIQADFGGGYTTTKSLTITVLDVMTDLVASVTETISKEVSSYNYVVSNNNQQYVLNLITTAWSFIDNAPYSNVIYRNTTQKMIAARRDTGNICTLDADTDDYTINWVLRTGFYSFSKLDEMKEMPDGASQALKRIRKMYADVKSTGNITVTIFTEQDATGKTFTITPETTDYVVYNRARIALSRDVRGKYISFQFSGSCRVWIGDTSINIAPRSLR